MSKKLKKIIIILCLFTFLNPVMVKAGSNADTLKELRAELAAYKAKKAQAESNKTKTQSQINASKNNISVAQTEIETNQNKITEAKQEIANLELQIADSKKKINSLMKEQELLNNNNTVLEYIFGSKSISELIIRLKISSQLANYNEELMTDYKNKIEENEQLQIDLVNREETLNKKIEELESSIDSLGNSMSSYVAEALSASEDITSTQKLIDYYVKLGCSETESLTACVAVKGDTKFIKPLYKGVITSYYGYRTHPVTGVKNSLHTGLDIGGNAEGTNVYAAANGIVGKIVYKASCGGNQVYIYHTINGVKYTTLYMHLLNISVSLGQKVDTNTVVGHVGGYSTSKSHGGYDTCTTGAHLHFTIAKGWYGSTYVSYSTFVANLLDPRTLLTFPNKGTYFYSRY